MAKKSAFPGISRGNKNTSQNGVVENIEILTGVRGDGSNRALLVKDLVNIDEMKRKALIQSIRNNNSGGNNGLPIDNGNGIEAPTAPQNVIGTGGFTFIAIQWDKPNYKGHAYAEIFRSETDSFSSAVLIATEVTQIYSDNVNMGSAYYYWVRFVNKADMRGPIQGANGIYVETQQSAEQILSEIGGKIEKSHLGTFLTTEVDKIPLLETDIAPLKSAIYDVDGVVETAKSDALNAKLNIESIANNLVDAALINDKNWQNNTQTIASISSSLNNLSATVSQEFYTRTEANSAIAASAETIRAEIEANGIALSSDITNTYYTKAAADSAIALANTELKAQIEDPNGTSLGATLQSSYYTSAQTDNAISTFGTQLKSEIENPNGTSLGATLSSNYYTKSDTDTAISQQGDILKSQIEDPNGTSLGATLQKDYYTKTNSDAAISRGVNSLNATFDLSALSVIENALANDLANNAKLKSEANIIEQQKTIAEENKSSAEKLSRLEAKYIDSNADYTELTKSIATQNSATNLSIIKLDSSIKGVSATLENEYYTIAEADAAVSAATTTLKAQIEDPNGTSLGAALQTDYYTAASTDLVISSAITTLKSDIENPNGSSVGATLQTNYYTKTATDNAITSATTQLKSEIEDISGTSLGADLYNNYYTKTAADAAISSANTILKSEIEDAGGSSVGASLQTLSETVATNQGEFSAMWGVKTTVAQITASFGLLNDGVNPIFAIKGAKFAIIDDVDPTVLTPVFAVSNGKTVINSAVIDQAFIQSLVTDNLLSNRVTVGNQLSSPSINYDPVTGTRTQNFSIDPNGNLVAKSAVLDSATLKAAIVQTANGDIVVNANGDIDGAWIKNLMVDYLQIQNQAVTSPHAVEITSSVSVSNSRTYTYTIGAYVGGGIQYSIAMNAYRYTASSGGDEILWCKVILKSDGVTIKEVAYPVPVPFQSKPNNGSVCGMFDDALLGLYLSTNITIELYFYSAGLSGSQSINFNAHGFISYAKR